MTVQDIRNTFETAAHSGYVGYGLSMTDGYYAPEPVSVTRSQLRRAVPLTADYFRYQTDFHPTDEQIAEYNATFEVGASWKPDHLDLAVAWQTTNGLKWRTYEVTGTRHAYYLIRKLAGRKGFRRARLQEWLVGANGYATENIIGIAPDDVTSDRHGVYRALLNKSNSHYDLQRDDREEQRVLNDQETQSDRDAWYDMDR
jgi:hypothetical protein